jgi:hypothetical protein
MHDLHGTTEESHNRANGMRTLLRLRTPSFRSTSLLRDRGSKLSVKPVAPGMEDTENAVWNAAPRDGLAQDRRLREIRPKIPISTSFVPSIPQHATVDRSDQATYSAALAAWERLRDWLFSRVGAFLILPPQCASGGYFKKSKSNSLLSCCFCSMWHCGH